MKIGVSALAWTTRLNSSHLDLFPALREHGIEALEIPLFDPAELNVAALCHAFHASGLTPTVCAILPNAINPISPDAAERSKARAYLAQCIETAAEMGACLIGGPVFAPNGYFPGHRRNQDEWTWAVEIFQSLRELLDTYQITLSIEPVNRSESFFLNTGAEAKAFCEAIDHPRVGVTIDTFHANIEEKNIAQTVLSLGAGLKHLHASENDRGLLGSGHVDFPAIVAALRQIDYDGLLMIEGFGYSASEPESLGALWGDLLISPEDIAYRGAEYLRGLLI